MHVYLNSIEIPTTLALAIMAILGYVFGTLRERGKACGTEALLRLQRDLSRAEKAVKELGETVCAVRSSTTRHYCRLKKFQAPDRRTGRSPGRFGLAENYVKRSRACWARPSSLPAKSPTPRKGSATRVIP